MLFSNAIFRRSLGLTLATLTLLVVALLFAWSAPLWAQDLGPERPTRHQDAVLVELLAADQAAYAAALAAYDNLVVERTALIAADAALEEALASGEAQSSPDEDLAALAQDVINARVGQAEAQAVYDIYMANLAIARGTYEAAVGEQIDELMALEDAISEANDFAATQAARITGLETQIAALLAATCAGHDYDHAHAGAYSEICAQTSTNN